MEAKPGQLHFSSDWLLHALSLVDPSQPIRRESLDARVKALADVVEWMLLAEHLVVDNAFWPEVEPKISEFHLRSLIKVTSFPDVRFLDHAPMTLAPMRKVALQGGDPANFKSAAEFLLSAWSQDGMRATAVENFPEILDYVVTVCKPDYEDLDYESVGPTWQLLESYLTGKDDPRVEQMLSDDAVLAALNGVMLMTTESALREATIGGSALFPSTLSTHYLAQMPLFGPSSKVLLSKLGEAQENAATKINDYYHGRYTSMTRLPVLFGWVVSKAGTLRELFEVACDLRERREVRAYRRWCTELDHALQEGREAEAVRMIDQAEREIRRLTSASDNEIPVIEAQISFPPSVSFPVPGDWFPSRRNHLVFLRRVHKETLGPVQTRIRLKKIIGYDYL